MRGILSGNGTWTNGGGGGSFLVEGGVCVSGCGWVCCELIDCVFEDVDDVLGVGVVSGSYLCNLFIRNLEMRHKICCQSFINYSFSVSASKIIFLIFLSFQWRFSLTCSISSHFLFNTEYFLLQSSSVDAILISGWSYIHVVPKVPLQAGVSPQLVV